MYIGLGYVSISMKDSLIACNGYNVDNLDRSGNNFRLKLGKLLLVNAELEEAIV